MANAIKIAILGPCYVGKTSLVKRLKGHDFRNITETTIGACFTQIRLGDAILNVWDTAGEERFRAIAPIYYRGAHILIFVFDVTVLASMDNMIEFMDEAMKISRGQTHFIVVGNKIDRLHPDHQVLLDRFRNNIHIKTYGLERLDIIFTSAQTSAGLDMLETKMMKLIDTEITIMDVGKILVADTVPAQSSSCAC